MKKTERVNFSNIGKVLNTKQKPEFLSVSGIPGHKGTLRFRYLESIDGFASEVLETKEYDIFSLLNGNRNIERLSAHQDKLTKSFKEGQLLSPAIIDRNLRIVDGQNRWVSCKKNGFWFQYVITLNVATIRTAQLLNENQKSWTMDDYGRSWAKLGRDEYGFYNDYRNEFKLSCSDSVCLLMTGRPYQGNNPNEKHLILFKKGKLTTNYFDAAQAFAASLMRFKKYYCRTAEPMSGRKLFNFGKSSFVRAWANITIGKSESTPQKCIFDIERFFEKLEKNESLVDLLPRATGTTGFMRNIEDIYNYMTREDKRVRLF